MTRRTRRMTSYDPQNVTAKSTPAYMVDPYAIAGSDKGFLAVHTDDFDATWNHICRTFIKNTAGKYTIRLTPQKDCLYLLRLEQGASVEIGPEEELPQDVDWAFEGAYYEIYDELKTISSKKIVPVANTFHTLRTADAPDADA